MKINHWKINWSIQTNLCQLVNILISILVLVNRWSIDSHIKLSANDIDCHQLLLITSVSVQYKWIKIDEKSQKPVSLISNINRLVGIDFDRLTNSSIAYAETIYIVTMLLIIASAIITLCRIGTASIFSFNNCTKARRLNHSSQDRILSVPYPNASYTCTTAWI